MIPPHHSWRSTWLGSSVAARVAGKNAAATPMALRIAAVEANVNGSVGWMPKRTERTVRAAAMAAGRPIASPTATSSEGIAENHPDHP